MDSNTKVALNLSNCIIGVSILAMPYCMKTCGLLLGVVMMTVSCSLTRFTCHLLLKSALVSRRKSFELLAFHTFGHAGKLAAEINIIGFLLGILISFFVVIGDLAPVIISKTFALNNSSELRVVVLVLVGFGITLPLAMLKEVEALVRISTLSVLFYSALALKTVAEAFPVLLYDTWRDKIALWEPSGLLQTLPIFSLALSCQTQLFEVFGTLPDASLKQMNGIVKLAVYLSTTLYLTVGVFGYIANASKDFTGNILLSFSPGLLTDVIKLCFVLSVAMSFPLVIFPCRTSIHSLLFRKSTGPFDISGSFIPEIRFKIITLIIVTFTLLIGILCPNIELVLSFIGSTIGILTCIIFPALMFIHIVSKHTFERWGSQLVLIVGILLLASCTWENINHNDEPEEYLVKDRGPAEYQDVANALDKNVADIKIIEALTQTPKIEMKIQTINDLKSKDNAHVDCRDATCNISDTQKRLEPPVPQEPEEHFPDSQHANPIDPVINMVVLAKKSDKEVDPPPETKKPENTERTAYQHQEELLKKLEAQQIEQKKLLEEQREILEELKAHERSHNKQDQDDNSNKQNLADETPKEQHQPEVLKREEDAEKSLKIIGNNQKSEAILQDTQLRHQENNIAKDDNDAIKRDEEESNKKLMSNDGNDRPITTSRSPNHVLAAKHPSQNGNNPVISNFVQDSDLLSRITDALNSRRNQRGGQAPVDHVHEGILVNGTGRSPDTVRLPVTESDLKPKQTKQPKLGITDGYVSALKINSFPPNNDSVQQSERKVISDNSQDIPSRGPSGGELYERKKVGRDLKLDLRQENVLASQMSNFLHFQSRYNQQLVQTMLTNMQSNKFNS